MGNNDIYNTHTTLDEEDIYLNILREQWNYVKENISCEYERVKSTNSTYALYLGNLINQIQIDEKLNDYINTNLRLKTDQTTINEKKTLLNFIRKYNKDFLFTKNIESKPEFKDKNFHYRYLLYKRIETLKNALPIYKTYLNRLDEELKHSSKFINYNNINKFLNRHNNDEHKIIYKINKEIPDTRKLVASELKNLPAFIEELKYYNKFDDNSFVWKKYGPILNQELAQIELVSAEINHLNDISKIIDSNMNEAKIYADNVTNMRENLQNIRIVNKIPESTIPSKLRECEVYDGDKNPTIASISTKNQNNDNITKNLNEKGDMNFSLSSYHYKRLMK